MHQTANWDSQIIAISHSNLTVHCNNPAKRNPQHCTNSGNSMPTCYFLYCMQCTSR